MVGTPVMQLSKFNKVYDVIKGKVPLKLETLYRETLDNLVSVLRQKKLLLK